MLISLAVTDPQVLLGALRRLSQTDHLIEQDEAIRIARLLGLPEDWIQLHLTRTA